MDDDERAERNRRINEAQSAAEELVDSLADRLPAQTVNSAQSDLHAGEPLYVVNNVSATLVLDGIAVTSAQRDLLARALTAMGHGHPAWATYLQDHEATLARITVED